MEMITTYKSKLRGLVASYNTLLPNKIMDYNVYFYNLQCQQFHSSKLHNDLGNELAWHSSNTVACAEGTRINRGEG